MRLTLPLVTAAACLAFAASAAPALAFGSGGGNGGDREPAGGAFMSSYPEQGSTGIQKYGPPRSADIPRANPYRYGYGDPDYTGSIRRAPPYGYYYYGR